MSSQLIESLEARQLLSADPVPVMGPNLAASADTSAGQGTFVALAPAGQKTAARKASGQKKQKPADVAKTTALSQTDVQNIIAAAASQMKPTQAVAVTDRSGDLIGLYLGSGLNPADLTNNLNPFATFTGGVVLRAVQRARTAAAFQSRGEAFTTRTARYIILNNFPKPIRNTGGGPLYGVEFSVLLGSDVVPGAYQTPLLSGDPGGVPLYINNIPVGGVGVAGDMDDVLPLNSPALQVLANDVYGKVANPNARVFTGDENPDFDESVAMAGAKAYRAPIRIRANQIFVGGLKLPFTASREANKNPPVPFSQLSTAVGGQTAYFPRLGLDPTVAPTGIRAGEPERVNATIAGIRGLLRITDNMNPREDIATGQIDPTQTHVDIQESDPVRASDDVDASGAPRSDADKLTAADVMQVMRDAVNQSKITRAGIRKPNGVHARIHIIVADRDGTVLGAFREEDATNFSYDVAVQKARTASYFSDDQHAVTATAVGFMSQKFFPTGIDNGVKGPLFGLQDRLSLYFKPPAFDPTSPDFVNFGKNMKAGVPVDPKQPNRFQRFPLSNGMIIFPGGAPLYKNGQLVGAVGISGDGVLQDDYMAYGGTLHFRPKEGQQIRTDQFGGRALADYFLDKLRVLETAPGIDLTDAQGQQPSQLATQTIGENRELQLPYLKFPRNPNV